MTNHSCVVSEFVIVWSQGICFRHKRRGQNVLDALVTGEGGEGAGTLSGFPAAPPAVRQEKSQRVSPRSRQGLW